MSESVPHPEFDNIEQSRVASPEQIHDLWLATDLKTIGEELDGQGKSKVYELTELEKAEVADGEINHIQINRPGMVEGDLVTIGVYRKNIQGASIFSISGEDRQPVIAKDELGSTPASMHDRRLDESDMDLVLRIAEEQYNAKTELEQITGKLIVTEADINEILKFMSEAKLTHQDYDDIAGDE